MKKTFVKVIAMAVIVAALFVFLPGIAQAEQGNKFLNAIKKIITYPFNVTKKSVEVTTDTATKAVETGVNTGKAAAGVVTLDLEKTDDLIVEPVKGAAETAVTAVEGTVKMPGEAAVETMEEEAVEATEAK